MNGRIADVVAVYDNGDVVVEEHETTASMYRSHSVAQDRDLKRHAARRRYMTYSQVITDE